MASTYLFFSTKQKKVSPIDILTFTLLKEHYNCYILFPVRKRLSPAVRTEEQAILSLASFHVWEYVVLTKQVNRQCTMEAFGLHVSTKQNPSKNIYKNEKQTLSEQT